jgi:hypothetical protein
MFLITDNARVKFQMNYEVCCCMQHALLKQQVGSSILLPARVEEYAVTTSLCFVAWYKYRKHITAVRIGPITNNHNTCTDVINHFFFIPDITYF